MIRLDCHLPPIINLVISILHLYGISFIWIPQEIYKIGGRKFGFLNLGDLGCLPGLRMLNSSSKNGCLEKASKMAKLHNVELYNMLLKMEKQLKGFKYSLYDFNSSLRERIDHPAKYGMYYFQIISQLI